MSRKEASGLLTRKQLWRRTRTATEQTHASLLGTSSTTAKQQNDWRNASDTNLSSSSQQQQLQESNMRSNKKWSTEGDLQEINGKKAAAGKRVNFNKRVRVVLIPCALEYVEAGLSAALWWSDDDYRLFKSSARRELEFFLSVQDDLDCKSALRRLYQSSSHDS